MGAFKNDVNLKYAITQLNAARKSGPDGVSISSSDLSDSFDALVAFFAAAADFDERLIHGVRNQITRDAIFAATKKVVTRESLERSLHKSERAYLARALEPYHLVTTLSLKHASWLRRIRRFDADFNFSLYRPKGYELPENAERAAKGFSWVRLRCEGRSPSEAGEIAMESLDSLRAVWNLAINYTIRHRGTVMGKNQGVNQIRLGPDLLLYDSKKTLCPIRWYIPPQYQAEKPCDLNAKAKWERFQDLDRQITANLRHVPFKADVLKLLRGYSAALDSNEHEMAFIRLWAILEQLTNCEGHHQKLTKRTSALYKEREEVRIDMDHLRRLRNAAVHAGRFPSNGEPCLYQLKRYVEAVFVFLMGPTCRGFQSIREAAQFLDLPSDKATLQEQIDIRKLAIYFRR